MPCEVKEITDAVKAKLESLDPKEEVEVQFAEGTTDAGFKTIARVPWLRKVSIRSKAVTDLGPAAKLGKLAKLDAYGCSGLTSVAPLSRSTELKELSLYMTKVADLAPLKGLGKLEVLDLYATPVTDLSPIAGLKGLKKLNLYMVKAKDWTPIKGLTNLEDVWLHFSDLKDLKVLGGMTKMRSLGLSWSNDLADISALSAMPELEDLELADCPVKSIAPLAKLAKLRRVTLRGTQVKDLGPLQASAKTLQSLEVPKGTPAAAFSALKKASSALEVRVEQ
jgi:Leucine-rich repeat (LRR) protein